MQKTRRSAGLFCNYVGTFNANENFQAKESSLLQYKASAKNENNLTETDHASKLLCIFASKSVSCRISKSDLRLAAWLPSRLAAKKSAFTLAEVLITLGIICVVAALTLPTLVANYQKKVTVTKLEKAYTILNQAFKQSEVENESSEHWDNAFVIGAENYFNKYWKPYFNGAERCKKYQDCGYNSNTPFNSLNGQKSPVTVNDASSSRILFRINDEIVYLLFASMGSADGSGSVSSNQVWIDINGGKAPNTFGKDVFMFNYVAGKGVLPYGYAYSAASCSKTQSGSYCSKKIMQNGWQITSDYPW